MRPHLIAASLLTLTLITASQADAQETPSEDRAKKSEAPERVRAPLSWSEGVMFMPGLTAGLSLGHTRGDGVAGVLGGELSVVKYNFLDGLVSTPIAPLSSLGLYVDGVWDFSADALRLSAGPEVAWALFGLDGGYMMQRRAGQLKHGANARFFISLGVLGCYVRVGSTFGQAPERMMELGLLFKLPVVLR